MKIKPGKGTGTKTVFDADGRQLDALEALQSGFEVCLFKLHAVNIGIISLKISLGDGLWADRGGACTRVTRGSLVQEPEARSAIERFQDERERMRQRDAEDRVVEKRKRQEARARKKAKAREAEDDPGPGGAAVTLGLADSGDSGSSGEADMEEPEVGTKRRRMSAAYRGMAGSDGEGAGSGSEGSPEAGQPALQSMSVAEQEALALRLL